MMEIPLLSHSPRLSTTRTASRTVRNILRWYKDETVWRLRVENRLLYRKLATLIQQKILIWQQCNGASSKWRAVQAISNIVKGKGRRQADRIGESMPFSQTRLQTISRDKNRVTVWGEERWNFEWTRSRCSIRNFQWSFAHPHPRSRPVHVLRSQ